MQYLDGANESVLVMVQIETVQGMQNVEEIAAVDGIGQSLVLLKHHCTCV